MSEFPTDQHKLDYITGLVREADGYKAKISAAESRDDEGQVRLYSGRLEQVAAELERVGANAATRKLATR